MNRNVTVIGMITSIVGIVFVLIAEYKSLGFSGLVESLEFMVGLILVLIGIVVSVVGLAIDARANKKGGDGVVAVAL